MSEELTAIKKAEAWSTAKIYAALAVKYAEPEYALLFEVPNGTGSNKSRSADALAMSLWPSRGLHLIGFEVKASRSDWVREKANPAKAEAIAKYCHYWYIVAGSATIVGPGELPPTWGLLVPKGDRLTVSVEAPKLAPRSVDADLLAGIFRRASEKFQRDALDREAIARARREGYEQGKKAAQPAPLLQIDRAKEDLERLRKIVAEFEESSGLKLPAYSGSRRLGEVVRTVMHGGLDIALAEMKRIARDAATIVELAAEYERVADSTRGDSR